MDSLRRSHRTLQALDAARLPVVAPAPPGLVLSRRRRNDRAAAARCAFPENRAARDHV
ncbi:hypothetical protein QZH56_35255 [Streptomyces olivoreticuli]|uniref:hypothetical protein n=1 Tax=Streptomyces olivoreticuli TaxID=68246 RepID=UPI00265A421C|nr:hypothetical protein [Streptomyces olivoreticuli]WKK23891.1 hypothetical protein QZH56_35255 [Streptomyces olivoreticuli]